MAIPFSIPRQNPIRLFLILLFLYHVVPVSGQDGTVDRSTSTNATTEISPVDQQQKTMIEHSLSVENNEALWIFPLFQLLVTGARYLPGHYEDDNQVISSKPSLEANYTSDVFTYIELSSIPVGLSFYWLLASEKAALKSQFQKGALDLSAAYDLTRNLSKKHRLIRSYLSLFYSGVFFTSGFIMLGLSSPHIYLYTGRLALGFLALLGFLYDALPSDIEVTELLNQKTTSVGLFMNNLHFCICLEGITAVYQYMF